VSRRFVSAGACETRRIFARAPSFQLSGQRFANVLRRGSETTWQAVFRAIRRRRTAGKPPLLSGKSQSATGLFSRCLAPSAPAPPQRESWAAYARHGYSPKILASASQSGRSSCQGRPTNTVQDAAPAVIAPVFERARQQLCRLLRRRGSLPGAHLGPSHGGPRQRLPDHIVNEALRPASAL